MPDIDRRSALTGAAALLGASLARPAHAATASIVTTRKGRVAGTREGGLHVFRGLRYGQDTALRRFQAPLAPDSWTGTVDASAFAPSCPQ